MVNNPLISVALPVKNGMPNLKQTIDALKRQTYRRFELVVQDAVSTDGSVEYVSELREDFPVRMVSEPDGSLVKGYNRAFARCQGELVVAAACDEVLDDDALRTYVSWYREHPNAVIVYGGSRLVDPWGGIAQFQPLDFHLVDYLRHAVCPTTAGFFNRAQLGSELRMDESLKTVPDFELFTRVALRFGEHRIVCKRGFTMTARRDSSSMTYRAESLSQFARDKGVVIDRLLSGPLRDEFTAYLRNDLVFHMQTAFADLAEAIPGGDYAAAHHVLGAAAAMPHDPRLMHPTRRNRFLRWDANQSTPVLRQNVAPVPPPPEATIVAELQPSSIYSPWTPLGARVEQVPEGARVTTGADSWTPAAVVEIPTEYLDAPWCWLRVRYSDVRGGPVMGLGNPTTSEISYNKRLARTEGTEAYFELYDAGFSVLALGNGETRQVSSVVINAMEILMLPLRRVPSEPVTSHYP